MKRNHVSYDNSININGKVFIKNYGGIISFGKGDVINSSHRSNPIGGNTFCSFVANKGASIIIGDNVGISNTSFYAFEKIVVEDGVMIGGSCCIYDTDFHSLRSEMRSLKGGDTDIAHKPVIIKKRAFIGGHSIILKGVTIGENSVIGAGSVVTKNVPPNEVWAGNPAKFIKQCEV